MTREEAKAIIQRQKQAYIDTHTYAELRNENAKDILEAYCIAEKALEQKPNCPFYEIDDDGHGICKNHRYMDECEDAVSREGIKRAYKQRMVDSLKDDKQGIDLSKYAEEPYERFCEFIDSI